MLLIVDEAHDVPRRVMQEIHMITNLVREGQPRVQLVLAGTSSLEQRLVHPKLESLQQRIAARLLFAALRLRGNAAVRNSATRRRGRGRRDRLHRRRG